MTAVAGKQLCDFDPWIGGPPLTAADARMCCGETEDPPQLRASTSTTAHRACSSSLPSLQPSLAFGRLSKTRGKAAGQPRPKVALSWRHGFVKPSCETLYRTSSALVPSSGSSRRELASAFLCQHRIQFSLSWSHCRTQCAADMYKQPNPQTARCLLKRGTAVIDTSFAATPHCVTSDTTPKPTVSAAAVNEIIGLRVCSGRGRGLTRRRRCRA